MAVSRKGPATSLVLALSLALAGPGPSAADLDSAAQAIRERRYDEAIRELEALLDADPDDERGNVLLGMAFVARGEASRAVPPFERAVARRRHPPFVLRLAHARLAAGQVDAALGWAHGLAAEYPDGELCTGYPGRDSDAEPAFEPFR